MESTISDLSAVSRTSLIVGNWKMNGSRGAAKPLLSTLASRLSEPGEADVAVCAPFPYLESIQRELSGSRVAWGAQTLSEFDCGAHTGEVSAHMLRDFGCRYVLVGHSERRTSHGESDALTGLKTLAAVRAGLVPIVCVGESLEEREADSTISVVVRQLDAALSSLPREEWRACVVAYEPVWAIGTGLTATPGQAQAVHAELRAHLAAMEPASADAIRILYGGSVKPDAAAALFAQPDVDGGLIGAASLVAEDFLAIVAAA